MGEAKRRKQAGTYPVITDRPEHVGHNNYEAPLQELAARVEVKRGTVQHVTILHDSWCAIYDGGACNCKPIVRLGK
jgi:hypothetical protein